MYRLIVPTVTVAMWMGWAGPSLAADKLLPEEGATQVMLLLQPLVGDDLKLARDKREKIHEFAIAQWKKAQAVNELDHEERDRKFATMAKENQHFLDETLTAEQRKRLDEIALQEAGLLCLTRADIAEKLELTSEQQRKAVQLLQGSLQEMEELIDSSGGESKEESLQDLRKACQKRLQSLLTEKQKKTWKEICGAPFEGKLFLSESRTSDE
ncbi:MAG TPA: hypothetical protein VFI31_04305 [Pirellulales bacterium]|nr:hypothetical protein [Pirellulales bacterium]